MTLFANRTSLNDKIFQNIAYNLKRHTSLRSKEGSDTEIIYVESAAEARGQGIFVIMEKELYLGDYSSVSTLADTFILNPSQDFFENGAVSAADENGAMIANYDVFANIYFHSMGFFTDESAAYGDRPYAEYMMDMFASSASERSGGRIFVSGRDEAVILPTFDIDRLHYFALSADIKNLFLYLFAGKKTAMKYLGRRLKRRKDPWNRVDEILSFLNEAGMRAVFFILPSSRDKFARRYSRADSVEVFRKAGKTHDVGVHLTYESGDNTEKITDEIGSVERSLKVNVLFSRFHYLHSLSRDIIKKLDSNGIAADSSVGFRDRTGFKSGFSKPYMLPESDIVEVPVICMDSAIMMESMKEGSGYGEMLGKLMEHIRRTGGAFTFIFHQSALDDETFPGYRDLFGNLIECGRKEGLSNPSFAKYVLSFRKNEEWNS